MPRLVHQLARYRLHKPSGQARVCINRGEIWLGRFASRESREKYERAVAEWIANYQQPKASPAEEFGPLALRAVRDEMISLNWSRSYINRQVLRIKSVFRWAVEHQHIAGTSLQQLLASAPVQPVPEAHIDAVLPFLSSTVQAMVKLQAITDMRPGELFAMVAREVTSMKLPDLQEALRRVRPLRGLNGASQEVHA